LPGKFIFAAKLSTMTDERPQMKTFFHILIKSIDPQLGGMETSALRIANFFLDMGRTRVAIYERRSEGTLVSDNDRLEFINMTSTRSLLARPLDNESFAQDVHENSRLDKLCLSSLIRQKQLAYPNLRHVIVSFYISRSGFIAQLVANDLRIPHIACVRGTDFNKDFFSPLRFPATDFVLKQANFIITTNNFQKETLVNYLGRQTRIKTIYNSVPDLLLDPLWAPHNRAYVQLFADCGYSYKKSTHILLSSVLKAHNDGFPVHLCLVGSMDMDRKKYWLELKDHYQKNNPEIFELQDYVSRDAIRSLLLESDIYCSASIGEGCSNGSLLALSLGIPIVSTDTGALSELAQDDPSVFLSLPGNIKDLEDNIRTAAAKYLKKELIVNRDLAVIKKLVGSDREKYEWSEVVAELLPKRDTVKRAAQKRVLFFVHDGNGLGHLRRLSRLAHEIQGDCAALVVSGHRAASFIVPPECEYVHLPSFDSLLPNKSGYWGRKPFLEINKEGAIKLRVSILNSIIESFDPDAIVVDYLPLGKYNELIEIIKTHRSLKYFIMRGVLDHTDNVRIDILGGEREYALANYFHRILVSSDQAICDVSKEYDLGPAISSKLSYIGYVSNAVSKHMIKKMRTERGLLPGDLWVICSAGGGALGEKLTYECEKLSQLFPEHYFDIILGPRSSRQWEFLSGDIALEGNTRLLREFHNLSLLHAAGDIVICPGGYNSLVEAMEGESRIICVPAQLRSNDEQYIHSQRLKAFYPIEMATNTHELISCFKSVLNNMDSEIGPIRKKLNFNGIENFRKILFSDLGINYYENVKERIR
jgi:predicted glycosyltransferase/glycosyltransferase involved in cell wall biosynthesis